MISTSSLQIRELRCPGRTWPFPESRERANGRTLSPTSTVFRIIRLPFPKRRRPREHRNRN